MSNPNINWNQRGNDNDIVYTGSSAKNSVCCGCCVSLTCDDVTVFCRVCDDSNSPNFTGTIENFKNWNETSWNGFCVGDEITFHENCVWTCDCTKVAA